MYSLRERVSSGEGLWALDFHSQDCRHSTLSSVCYQKIQLAPTTNLLEEWAQKEGSESHVLPAIRHKQFSESGLCRGDRALQPLCKALGQLICHC